MAASRGRVLERLRARLSFFEAAPCFRTVRHVLIALIAPPSTVVQLTSIRSERELVYVQEAAWRLGSLRPTCFVQLLAEAVYEENRKVYERLVIDRKNS